mmetsp:Transcript_48330/g.134994  ORF Transcript_48330/g.134994 Transcript_48330/m.134994 type:complete len:278 (+) Transcript_48330:3537-4370(+)
MSGDSGSNATCSSATAASAPTRRSGFHASAVTSLPFTPFVLMLFMPSCSATPSRKRFSTSSTVCSPIPGGIEELLSHPRGSKFGTDSCANVASGGTAASECLGVLGVGPPTAVSGGPASEGRGEGKENTPSSPIGPVDTPRFTRSGRGSKRSLLCVMTNTGGLTSDAVASLIGSSNVSPLPMASPTQTPRVAFHTSSKRVVRRDGRKMLALIKASATSTGSATFSLPREKMETVKCPSACTARPMPQTRFNESAPPSPVGPMTSEPSSVSRPLASTA